MGIEISTTQALMRWNLYSHLLNTSKYASEALKKELKIN